MGRVTLFGGAVQEEPGLPVRDAFPRFVLSGASFLVIGVRGGRSVRARRAWGPRGRVEGQRRDAISAKTARQMPLVRRGSAATSI